MYKFFEVFKTLRLPEELGSYLADTEVTRVSKTSTNTLARVYLKSDRLIGKPVIYKTEDALKKQVFRMKNMFTVALKDELAAQSQMGKVRPATEAMLQKVRSYELSEKRLPITIEEQRELRNALNRLRDKYLAMGRYSDGIDSVILKVMKPNTSRRFFWRFPLLYFSTWKFPHSFKL